MIVRFVVAIVALVAAISASAAEPAKKLLILSGEPDGHPPTTHEFFAGVRVIESLAKKTPQIEVTTAKVTEPWAEGPDLINQADGIVLYVSQAAELIARDPRRQEAVQKLIDRGGGFVALHWGIGAKDEKYNEPFIHWLGGMHNGPDRKYKFGDIELAPVEPRHPIAAGIEPTKVHDEFYYDLKFLEPEEKVTPVMRATIDDQPYTVGWAYERPDGGRSFGFSGLHFHSNWKRPDYRRLVTQGILWSLKLPIPAEADVDLADEVYALPAAAAK